MERPHTTPQFFPVRRGLFGSTFSFGGSLPVSLRNCSFLIAVEQGVCGLAATESRPSNSKCLASVLNQDHPPAAYAFDRSIKMFEQTLQDLIKGIRNPKNDQVAFVAKAIQEIKDEIKSRDVAIKAQAIQKLTYVSRPKSGF